MVFSFLKEDNLSKKYLAAKEYTETLTEPFQEFERIASNRPSDLRDTQYSDVTDGTTAAVVRKLGKRVVQQLPTGKIETDDDNNWLPIVAEFVFTNKILPYANLEYDLIQKCWQAIERGATYGATAIYTPFVNHDGEFSTDMSLPYWGDVYLQPGKKSGNVCDYVFIRSWLQKDDIEALIDRENKMRAEAKKSGEPYESTWDVKGLEKIKESAESKPSTEQDPAERYRNQDPEGIEVVTGFQKGVGATFFTFCPAKGDDGKVACTIIRRKKNKDPRGKKPVDWYYNDADGFNPLGRGLVELIGALQNLIDSDMQMYQWNRALMLNPPLKKKGNFSKKKIVWAPGAIIDMGTDQNSDVEVFNVDTSAVVNYPDLYGLQKSQLLNLVSSPDTSISSEVGNPGFGKTPEALEQQKAIVSVDDNFVRKNFEAMFENWGETAVNLYFAERSGIEELQLDDATASKLRKLAEKDKFDLEKLSDDNKIMIDYDTDTPALKFRVDASTSKMKDDSEQGQILTSLIESVEKSPMLSQLVPQEKILAAWNRIVASSGVENPEDLTVDIDEFKEMQQQAMMQEQMAAEQAVTEAQTMGEQPMPIEGEVVEPQALDAAPMEQPIDEEVSQIAEQFRQLGVPEDLIDEAIQMADNGYSADEILAAIQGVMEEEAYATA